MKKILYLLLSIILFFNNYLIAQPGGTSGGTPGRVAPPPPPPQNIPINDPRVRDHRTELLTNNYSSLPCNKIQLEISKTNQEIYNITKELKDANTRKYLEEHPDFSPIINEDRTTKVGSKKGYSRIPRPINEDEKINKNPKILNLKNKLLTLQSSLSTCGNIEATPQNIANVPLANQDEIDEFNNIKNNQMGVAVLSGETTKPFYYHHNQTDELVYKYKKAIDVARLPTGINEKLKDAIVSSIPNSTLRAGAEYVIFKPISFLGDVAASIKDWFAGSQSTVVAMDCWYPDSEFKKTVCGTMKVDAHTCGQDYIHTKVTVDKDACFELKVDDSFNYMLKNRWAGDNFDHIEGEVQAEMKGLIPLNEYLSGKQIKKDDKVCLYGPWMADILDLNAKIPVPFTDKKLEITNIDIRNNNEIHPINQMWRKITGGGGMLLTSIADGTGYFDKVGNNEIQASGLSQKMRYHIAFELPINNLNSFKMASCKIDGFTGSYVYDPNTTKNIKEETLTLQFQGQVVLKIDENTIVNFQETHKTSFDKIRKRADGSIQGYIVVETNPINIPGGSINIIVSPFTISN